MYVVKTNVYIVFLYPLLLTSFKFCEEGSNTCLCKLAILFRNLELILFFEIEYAARSVQLEDFGDIQYSFCLLENM